MEENYSKISSPNRKEIDDGIHDKFKWGEEIIGGMWIFIVRKLYEGSLASLGILTMVYQGAEEEKMTP